MKKIKEVSIGCYESTNASGGFYVTLSVTDESGDEIQIQKWEGKEYADDGPSFDDVWNIVEQAGYDHEGIKNIDFNGELDTRISRLHRICP